MFESIGMFWELTKLSRQVNKRAMPTSKIEYEAMYTLLRNYCGIPNLKVADMTFRTMNIDEFKSIAQLIPLKTITYSAETWDCDDYAASYRGVCKLLVPGIAVGEVWNGWHAFNFFVDEQAKLWVIEPQENKILTVDEARKFYSRPSTGAKIRQLYLLGRDWVTLMVV